MKILKTTVLLSLFSTNSFAEINWKKLIDDMPYTTSEIVNISENGSIQMNVLIRPEGKLRFNGFNHYLSASEMTLYIDSPKQNLETLCNDYSLNNKSFKANFTFGVNPTDKTFDFTLQNGKKVSSLNFENPIHFSEPNVEFKNINNALWIKASNENKKYAPLSTSDWVTQVFKKAISSREQNIVNIDLSSYNGLACDLAFRNIIPRITKNISYISATPEQRKPWLEESKYREIFRSYFKNYELFKNQSNKLSEIETNNAFVLGYTISEDNQLKETLLSTPYLTKLLLNSLVTAKNKFGSDIFTANSSDFYKNTFEYKVPFVETTSQTLIIQTGKMTIKFLN